MRDALQILGLEVNFLVVLQRALPRNWALMKCHPQGPILLWEMFTGRMCSEEFRHLPISGARPACAQAPLAPVTPQLSHRRGTGSRSSLRRGPCALGPRQGGIPEGTSSRARGQEGPRGGARHKGVGHGACPVIWEDRPQAGSSVLGSKEGQARRSAGAPSGWCSGTSSCQRAPQRKWETWHLPPRALTEEKLIGRGRLSSKSQWGDEERKRHPWLGSLAGLSLPPCLRFPTCTMGTLGRLPLGHFCAVQTAQWERGTLLIAISIIRHLRFQWPMSTEISNLKSLHVNAN